MDNCPHQAKKDVRVELCIVCETGVRVGPDDDLQSVMAKHMSTQSCADAAAANEAKKKLKCPVQGCKAKLTQSGSVECGTCRQRVCLKHRFEDAHPCKVADHRCGGACGRESLASAVAGLLGRERLPMM